ncbi:MAG: hypothetical protein ICV85_03675 [Tolypothrix sp. T3-bin4]|nr:hypothetical protein [Tolypothrix sp. Co-bin9]MBD0301292.1 hypothetical protein [Tolypothrix sp. T3-bin4]
MLSLEALHSAQPDCLSSLEIAPLTQPTVLGAIRPRKTKAIMVRSPFILISFRSMRKS